MPRIYRIIVLLCALLALLGRLNAATEFPFRFEDGLIWVQVNSPSSREPLNFLLDSGAGESIVDLRTARRIGLKFGRSEKVLGIDGVATAYRIGPFKSSIGGVPIPRNLLALDLGDVSSGLSRRIDGLIGINFFQGKIVQIDYHAQRIRILDQEEFESGNSDVLPIGIRNGAMCVQVCIARQRKEWVRVDTGCSSALRWVVTDDKAKLLGVTSLAIVAKSDWQLTTEVRLGRTRFSNVKTALHNRRFFPGEAGLIGNGLLSEFTVTFDSKRRQLLLSHR